MSILYKNTFFVTFELPTKGILRFRHYLIRYSRIISTKFPPGEAFAYNFRNYTN